MDCFNNNSKSFVIFPSTLSTELQYWEEKKKKNTEIPVYLSTVVKLSSSSSSRIDSGTPRRRKKIPSVFYIQYSTHTLVNRFNSSKQKKYIWKTGRRKNSILNHVWICSVPGSFLFLFYSFAFWIFFFWLCQPSSDHLKTHNGVPHNIDMIAKIFFVFQFDLQVHSYF